MTTGVLWAGAFILLMMVAGFVAARRVKSFTDYAVSGRSMNFLFLFATLTCTVIGGATTIGFVALVTKIGLNFVWVVVAIVASNIFSGLFLAGAVRRLKVESIGGLYLHYYDKRAMVAANCIAFFTTVLLFAVQLSGMGKLLSALTGWELQLSVLFSTFVMLLYTWAGGIKAVARTDFLQFLFICAGIGCTLVAALTGSGGLLGLHQTLIVVKPAALELTGNMPASLLAGLFLTFFFGGMLSPSMVQRYASAKSEAAAGRSVLVFALFFLLFGVVIILLGLSFTGMKLAAAHEQELPVLMQTLLPEWLVGLGMAAIFAAVMSTADSFLNTSSILFVQTVWRNRSEETGLLRTARRATLVIGLLGLAVALFEPGILGLVKYAFAIWAPAMLPSMVPVLVAGRPLFSAGGALASIFSGALVMILFQAFAIQTLLGVPVIVVGLVVSTAVLLPGMLRKG